MQGRLAKRIHHTPAYPLVISGVSRNSAAVVAVAIMAHLARNPPAKCKGLQGTQIAKTMQHTAARARPNPTAL
jgi:hypothetical protein